MKMAETFWWAMPPGVAAQPGMTVWGVGVREVMHPGLCRRPEGMRVGHLIMCFHDAATLSSGGPETCYPARQLVAWTPDCPHVYGRTDGEWLHSWIVADGPDVGTLLEQCRIPVNTPISLPATEPVDDALRLAGAEVLRYSLPDGVILRSAIVVLLREVARLMQGTPARVAAPRQLTRLREFIDAHFSEPLTLDYLAKMANMSVPHLCREFKRHFGVPVIEQVIRCRMRRAAYLLHDPHARVGEVAAAVGYDDTRHFSKLFRKHYRISARQMREVVRDKKLGNSV